ncbi:MAG: diguanylate cyclase [Alphaproteobacteria bacterium]|nr:diguanylate cyclase [Alphaproteobacteria bacterium]
MALDYGLDNQLKELTEISAEHLDWFMQLTKRILFVGEHAEGQNFSRPQSYTAWYEEAKESSEIDEDLLLSLNTRYERLVNLSDKLINNHLKFKKPSDYQDYDELTRFFEGFMDTLRRVEKEMILDKNGIDPDTGLRKKSVLKKELDREMQRLARQGKPFSLALIRLDHYDEIAKHEGEHLPEYLKHIAELIKKSMRSFDDAYKMNDGEFILSLKQADVTGGVRALERLKELLQGYSYSFKSKELESKKASLSCCVAEPLPNDNLDNLLANMRNDLDTTDKNEDAVLEYYELSPLQRYIKTH